MNKVKILSVTAYCFIFALWSQAQCMNYREQNNDEPVMNHHGSLNTPQFDDMTPELQSYKDRADVPIKTQNKENKKTMELAKKLDVRSQEKKLEDKFKVNNHYEK